MTRSPAIERARIGLVAIGRAQIGGRVAVHQPDAGAFLQRRGAARGADAERVHEIDPLGRDQIGDRARVARQRERIGAVGDEPHPLAAEALQLAVERAVFRRHDHARARAQQRDRGVDRGARRRRLVQRGQDLQHGRAGQAAHAFGRRARHRHDGLSGDARTRMISARPCVPPRVAAKHRRRTR